MARRQLIYCTDQFYLAKGEVRLRLRSGEQLPDRMPDVGLDSRVKQCLGRLLPVQFSKGRQDILEQHFDPASLRCPVKFRGNCRLDRTAALVAEHDEQRCMQMDAGILQRPEDRRAEDVTGTRTTKSSPKPASKTSSGGTRLSLHPRMVA